MELEVLRRIENAENGTFTLVIGEAGEDPGSYYHYTVEPPDNIVGQLSAEDWERQTREHAIALEQTTRGESPAAPVRLGPPEDVQTSAQNTAALAELAADPNDLPPGVTRRPGDWREPPAVDERGADAGSSA